MDRDDDLNYLVENEFAALEKQDRSSQSCQVVVKSLQNQLFKGYSRDRVRINLKLTPERRFFVVRDRDRALAA